MVRVLTLFAVAIVLREVKGKLGHGDIIPVLEEARNRADEKKSNQSTRNNRASGNLDNLFAFVHADIIDREDRWGQVPIYFFLLVAFIFCL